MPGLSVAAVVSCWNGEKFLKRALASALAQTYTLAEVTVVDDGSTDGTPAVLEAFGSSVTVLRHPGRENRGQGASLNLAIRKTSSDLIAFLDHDDIWYPDKTTRQVEVFDNERDTGLVYTNGHVISEDDRKLHPILAQGFAETNRPESILLNCYIRTPSMVMVRRSLLDKVGSFSEDLLCPDHDMWVRMAEATRLHYLDAKLTGYRQHQGQLSLRRRMWEDEFRLLDAACRRHSYSPAVRHRRKAVIRYRLGQYDHGAGRYVSSAFNFFLAFLHDPPRAARRISRLGRQSPAGAP